jgi:hypothetical protein
MLNAKKNLNISNRHNLKCMCHGLLKKNSLLRLNNKF